MLTSTLKKTNFRHLRQVYESVSREPYRFVQQIIGVKCWRTHGWCVKWTPSVNQAKSSGSIQISGPRVTYCYKLQFATYHSTCHFYCTLRLAYNLFVTSFSGNFRDVDHVEVFVRMFTRFLLLVVISIPVRVFGSVNQVCQACSSGSYFCGRLLGALGADNFRPTVHEPRFHARSVKDAQHLAGGSRDNGATGGWFLGWNERKVSQDLSVLSDTSAGFVFFLLARRHHASDVSRLTSSLGRGSRCCSTAAVCVLLFCFDSSATCLACPKRILMLLPLGSVFCCC